MAKGLQNTPYFNQTKHSRHYGGYILEIPWLETVAFNIRIIGSVNVDAKQEAQNNINTKNPSSSYH